MKKALGLIVAALLIAGFAGYAAASFSDGDLIRVVYDKVNFVEVATDLGSISGLLNGTVTVSTDSFLGTVNGISPSPNWSNLFVAYFSFNGANYNVWGAAGSKLTGASGSKWGAADGGWNTYRNITLIPAGTNTVTTTNINGSTTDSYYRLLSGNSGIGNLGGWFATGSSVDASLASLASSNSISEKLYLTTPSTHAGSFTDLTITTYKTGTSSAVVPVPAAILLLAPGLAGLIGLRRRLS